jgi:hypothetical protein
VSAALIWVTVLVNSAGSFGLKLAGQSLPQWIQQIPRVNRMVLLLPLALLTALTTVLTFGDGRGLTLDARAAGMVFAVVALVVRAPFLVVVVGAAATAALVRFAVG